MESVISEGISALRDASVDGVKVVGVAQHVPSMSQTEQLMASSDASPHAILGALPCRIIPNGAGPSIA